MLEFFGLDIECKEYNDRTPEIIFKDNLNKAEHLDIFWTYDADCWEKDLFNLQCIMDEIDGKIPVDLKMPYIPNARMDRTSDGRPKKVFTLKTFARIINSMGFRKVIVYDPHSDVAPALIDRCEVIRPNLARMGDEIFKQKFCWIFPDAGALHRYKKYLPPDAEFAFGEKTRDWNSKRVTDCTLFNDYCIGGRDVMIVDDIISHGYTIYMLLEQVMKYKPASVKIFATHIEDSFKDGILYSKLKEGEFDAKVYTTASIKRSFGHNSSEFLGESIRRIEI